MEQLGIRDLRRSITAVVRSAGAGRRIVITIAGRPVAQLGPLEDGDSSRSLQELAARGELILARDPARPEPAVAVTLWQGTRIDHLLREVRGR